MHTNYTGPDTEVCLTLPTTQPVCLTAVLDTISVQLALAAVSKSVSQLATQLFTA